MFGLFRKSRNKNRRTCFARHQLGIDHRLESRRVMTTANLVGSVLTVEGTNAAETIGLQVVTSGTRKTGSILVVSDNGQPISKFLLSEIKRIEVRALGGDDKISVSGPTNVPTILDGGDGNDAIAGGDTGAVLLGRSGDDSLYGGNGRDVLIGGKGSDFIAGMGGDDIVVGDSTQADDNIGALTSILERWNSTGTYQERIDALRPRTDISRADRADRSTDLTLIDDGATDFLYGGAGQDWFLTTGSDKIGDQEKNEVVM
jgi:Ca2+-binding RTX toxin-like protein